MSHDTGYIDDAASSLTKHEEADYAFGQIPYAAHQGPLGIELLNLHADDIGIERQSGIIDKDIHAARFLFNLVDQGFYLIDICQISLKKKAVTYLRE